MGPATSTAPVPNQQVFCARPAPPLFLLRGSLSHSRRRLPNWEDPHGRPQSDDTDAADARVEKLPLPSSRVLLGGWERFLIFAWTTRARTLRVRIGFGEPVQPSSAGIIDWIAITRRRARCVAAAGSLDSQHPSLPPLPASIPTTPPPLPACLSGRGAEGGGEGGGGASLSPSLLPSEKPAAVAPFFPRALSLFHREQLAPRLLRAAFSAVGREVWTESIRLTGGGWRQQDNDHGPEFLVTDATGCASGTRS